MINDLVSIIVPVYKVEQYLDKCILSIVNQTYKNLEIILVNDGSPDGCPALCDEWASKDERIKVIHKPNGGLSSARNAGVEVATGKYIMFIDSDDYIEKEMIEELLCNLIKENADISIGNYQYVYEDKQNQNSQALNQIKVYENPNVFDCLIENNIQTTISCGKLFKAIIAKEIKFPIGKIHEDEFTVHKFLHNSNKVVYSNKAYYNYLIRSGSITSEKNKQTNTNLHDIEALQERIVFFENNKYSDKYIVFTYESIFNALIRRYLHCRNKDFKQTIKKLIEATRKEIEDKQYKKSLNSKVKIKLLLFKYCKPLLKFLIK